MQQTLLSILAIVVVGMFALGQQQDVASSERAVYEREMQERAAEKVRELLYEVQSLPFDEADIGSPSIRTNTAGLSAIGPESDEPTPSYFDDVDDYNGFTKTVSVSNSATDGGSVSHPVYLRVAVRYVRPDDPDQASAAQTLAKEILIEGFYGDSTPTPDVEPDVQLAQVVTPTWHQIHN
ncbi:MAG: hypothetical protein AAGG50_18225 [Bacteroidota bacterium]